MSCDWNAFLSEVRDHLRELRTHHCRDPFFRGQSKATWGLRPGLARVKRRGSTENRLYASFWSLGGHLLPAGAPTLDVLFQMQHCGMPTRLLDWSESFAVALYFAMKGCKGNAAVWVLDPYRLNGRSNGARQIEDLNCAFPKGYDQIFASSSPPYADFRPSVLAVYNQRSTSRMQWQRAVFTLHRDLDRPLEKLYPDCLKKFVVPRRLLKDARDFLQLAGVNEFTAFPDLDGLSRFLRSCELGGRGGAA